MPLKNSRSGNTQPFSDFEFFSEMGKIWDSAQHLEQLAFKAA
jgi:hypothetical protein